MTQEHIAFTIRFTEKEYYIMSKLVSALGVDAEEYIHDCVTAMFACDIDESFGYETPMRRELHRLDEHLRAT
jgi:hypothetical protein